MNQSSILTKEISFDGISNALYVFFKRFFDIIASLIGLVILIPSIILVKISYMLNGDYASIFFVQDRIGKSGKLFKMIKFRTMVIDADAKLVELLKSNRKLANEYRINKKLVNDPRITRAGKFVRKISLDELPQIINVFLGQMSLIGNRPYLPREIPDMGRYYNEIIKSKPGLSGLWQTSGRSNTTFLTRLKLETYYSNHKSFRLDVELFVKTFLVVFKGL